MGGNSGERFLGPDSTSRAERGKAEPREVQSGSLRALPAEGVGSSRQVGSGILARGTGTRAENRPLSLRTENVPSPHRSSTSLQILGGWRNNPEGQESWAGVGKEMRETGKTCLTASSKAPLHEPEAQRQPE